MVLLMLACPAMAWAMWGGRPDRMASVMNILLASAEAVCGEVRVAIELAVCGRGIRDAGQRLCCIAPTLL
ncbi:hypothetical protein ACIPW9_25045 [Streptomyces sp. NPDC090052]|uniref:hypothetical protein n=1 Tax=Streptomyces sp. NPDC090052 TaxID=3365931 RepID=UPI0038159564